MAAPGTWVVPALLVVLAAVTAALAGKLFERMSMVPGLLLAAVLVVLAAHQLGVGARAPLASAIFGALTISWLGAVVCALY